MSVERSVERVSQLSQWRESVQVSVQVSHGRTDGLTKNNLRSDDTSRNASRAGGLNDSPRLTVRRIAEIATVDTCCESHSRTAPSTRFVPQRQAVDELDHITECHDDNRALCGADLTEVPWVDEVQHLCVVCADLDDLHCGCECGCCDGDEETTHG